MKVDVRARVLWADPIATIRDDWLKKGAPAEAVKAALQESVRERNRHFRIRGLQDLGLGLLAFLLGLGAYFLQRAAANAEISISAKGFALIMIASVGFPLVGLTLTWRGARRLATGGAEEKGASDLSEFE